MWEVLLPYLAITFISLFMYNLISVGHLIQDMYYYISIGDLYDSGSVHV